MRERAGFLPSRRTLWSLATLGALVAFWLLSRRLFSLQDRRFDDIIQDYISNYDRNAFTCNNTAARNYIVYFFMNLALALYFLSCTPPFPFQLPNSLINKY